jgi:hypothetical protein
MNKEFQPRECRIVLLIELNHLGASLNEVVPDSGRQYASGVLTENWKTKLPVKGRNALILLGVLG